MRTFGARAGVAIALFAILGSVACSTTSSRLKARFAREQGCSVDRVAVADEGGAVYHATGCGKDTEYICPAFAGMGDSSKSCSERGLNPHAPMGEPPPRNTSRPDYESPK